MKAIKTKTRSRSFIWKRPVVIRQRRSMFITVAYNRNCVEMLELADWLVGWLAGLSFSWCSMKRRDTTNEVNLFSYFVMLFVWLKCVRVFVCVCVLCVCHSVSSFRVAFIWAAPIVITTFTFNRAILQLPPAAVVCITLTLSLSLLLSLTLFLVMFCLSGLIWVATLKVMAMLVNLRRFWVFCVFNVFGW